MVKSSVNIGDIDHPNSSWVAYKALTLKHADASFR